MENPEKSSKTEKKENRKKQPKGQQVSSVAKSATKDGEKTQTQTTTDLSTEEILPIPPLELNLKCENGCGRKLVILWEDWLSMKAHYRGKRIFCKECGANVLNQYVLEEGKNWKVIGED